MRSLTLASMARRFSHNCRARSMQYYQLYHKLPVTAVLHHQKPKISLFVLQLKRFLQLHDVLML
jgi:hypothetical protein